MFIFEKERKVWKGNYLRTVFFMRNCLLLAKNGKMEAESRKELAMLGNREVYLGMKSNYLRETELENHSKMKILQATGLTGIFVSMKALI